MIPPRFACFPHASAHGAALAARTLQPVAHDALVRNPVSVVERVNAYGLDAKVMPLHLVMGKAS